MPIPGGYYSYSFSKNGEYMVGIRSTPGKPFNYPPEIAVIKVDGTPLFTLEACYFVGFSEKGIITKKEYNGKYSYQYDFKGTFIDSIFESTGMYNADRSLSAVYDESGVRLYDRSGKLIKLFEEPRWKSDAKFSTEKNSYFDDYKKRGVTFSPSGKYLTLQDPNKIQIWDIPSLTLMGEISTGFVVNGTQLYTPPPNTRINFISEEQKLFVYLYDKIIVADIKGNILSETKINCGRECGPWVETAMSSDGKYAAQALIDNRIYTFNSETGKTTAISPAQLNSIISLQFSPNGKLLLSKDFNGNTKLWNPETLEEIAQFIPVDEKDYAIITPDGYYMASKNASKKVHFVKGIKTFTFENFDILYNRPDIVLQRIGYASAEIIAGLKNAYLKRLRKMGFTESQISLDAHVPEIEVTDQEIPLTTNQKFFSVNVKVSDSKYLLDRINVSVNGVSVFGLKGVSIKNLKTSESTKKITVELTSGKNLVQYSVLNEKGAESTMEKVIINYSGPVQKPDLYVVAIGVSNYVDNRFNLLYAAKDANDLADLFSRQQSKFAKVHVLKILDKEATAIKIKQAKEFYLKSKVEDHAILFAAGHGLLDDSLNFYFATSDINFDHPAQRGLPYEDLEDLVDGIPSRYKMVLIDACNSGEVDKENSVLTNDVSKIDQGIVASRGFKSVKKKDGLGLFNSFELMQNLFSDLTKGTGAMVISSASGSEFAFESSVWKNGVFTYAFLEGIKSKNADADKDQNFSVSELRDYVIKKVGVLTDGKQHPTSRKEISEFDFNVW